MLVDGCRLVLFLCDQSALTEQHTHIHSQANRVKNAEAHAHFMFSLQIFLFFIETQATTDELNISSHNTNYNIQISVRPNIGVTIKKIYRPITILEMIKFEILIYSKVNASVIILIFNIDDSIFIVQVVEHPIMVHRHHYMKVVRHQAGQVHGILQSQIHQ